MKKRMLLAIVLFVAPAHAGGIKVSTEQMAWQQVEKELKFHCFIERERYTTLDRAVRIVFAAEADKLEALKVRWKLKDGAGRTIAQYQQPIAKGLLTVTIDMARLKPGEHHLAAELVKGRDVLAEQTGVFRIESVEPPAQSGAVALMLPRGMPLKNGTWPVQTGVPFPKGALHDPAHIRVIDAAGNDVPVGTVVRSRWGHTDNASIRWLGVDFQPGSGDYTLEFGPRVRSKARTNLTVADTPSAVTINTGVARFSVRKQGFNVIDAWSVNGAAALKSSSTHGLYLVDHEGAVYRGANDPDVRVAIEEQTALRVVVRAEGWYVKDNAASPPTHDFKLPTDKLCKFVTRIEAYAGKPYVRVLNTLILTFDTFGVRLTDAGMSLPIPGGAAARATFGVAQQDPATHDVPASGLRLVQHLHDAFVIETGSGRATAEGEKSAGWVIAHGADAAMAVSHRDTWQRYPKEFEVLPNEMRFHVWPAHGKDHPEINQLDRDQMHRLLFAHQGRELNMATPWDYVLAACNYYDQDSFGVYKPVGHVVAAVHASGMGAATTSDVLIQLAPPDDNSLAEAAACFQTAPHALADPKWNCDSLAFGYAHPYDDQTFPMVESIIRDNMRGYWNGQDVGKMFGMWIYRSWLHSAFREDGAWELYRLYNGTHHHEAVIPWLLYARSGDPFYLTQGMANIRQLTDVQTIHYDDPNYTHKEFHFHQKRLVGSTRHDDAIVPWGADHGIQGHLTCYNASILAYYLTGDLRLREVVVDEWVNTVVADRANPEIGRADRSNTAYPQNPRDNSVAVGEILDAYQLTYDPRLLALLAPRWDIWLNAPGCMGADWGQPLHNALLFHGGEQVRQQLLEGVALWREGDFNTAYSSKVARPLHAAQEMFALAGIIDPQGTWAVDAFNMMSYSYLRTYAWRRQRLKPNVVHCNSGEYMLHLPRVMYALANSAAADFAPIIGAGHTAPRHTVEAMRIVVREDTDQTFTVYLGGKVDKKAGCDIQVFDADGILVARGLAPHGLQAPFRLRVPSDGKTGQYVVFIGANQKDIVYAPFTSLPEVYCTNFWTGDVAISRYFTRSPGPEPITLTVKPHKGPGTLLAPDLQTVLANTEIGESITADVGPAGVWVWNRAGYMGGNVNKDQPIILALTPDRWFMPNDSALAVEPAE